MLDSATYENFNDIVKSQAIVTILDGPDIHLTLEEVVKTKVEENSERPENCRKQPFTVILSGPASVQAQDGMYDISFEKVGLLKSVYMDNKAGTPESDKFNEKTAPENKAPAPEADKAALCDVTDLDPGHSQADELKVLYEIIFG